MVGIGNEKQKDGDPNYLTVRSTVRTIVHDANGTSGLRRVCSAFKNMYTGGFMRISKRALNSTITWYIYWFAFIVGRFMKQ